MECCLPSAGYFSYAIIHAVLFFGVFIAFRRLLFALCFAVKSPGGEIGTVLVMAKEEEKSPGGWTAGTFRTCHGG